MIIKIANKLDQKPLAVTYYSNDGASGLGTIPVRNVLGFSPNWAIQLNNTGQDKSEIVVLSSGAISGTTLVITGTTRFDHNADTPIFGIKWNQIVFKRSTSGTAGTAVALTDGTVSITPDNPFTSFDDTTASTGYAYKVCYRNSVTAEVSSDSDWLTTDGFSFYSKSKMKERVKGRLFSTKFFNNNDDSVIDTWLNEWMEDMTNTAVAVNKDYLLGTVDVAHGTNGLGTITSAGYIDVRSVWFTTDGASFFKGTKKDVNDIEPNTVYNAAHPYYYFLGDNVIGKLPDSTAGTMRLTFYNRPSLLIDDADEIPVSMRSYTNSFVDYAVSQAYYLDGQVELGDRYSQKAEVARGNFRVEISPRNKTGIEMMDITDAITGDEWLDYVF